MAARQVEPLNATAPAASAWVSANAGSGKTYVLVRRVLRLLLSGSDPGRILCLTFTRAAAAEMANRVFAQLGEWAALGNEELGAALAQLEGGEVEPGRLLTARALFAKAIETPGGLKIQTIHAFCERLLQQFPFEANVPAHFEVVDEGVGAELRKQALAATLAEADADPRGVLAQALDLLVGYSGDTRFADLIAQLLQRSADLRACVEQSGGLDASLAQLRSTLGLTAGQSSSAVRADIVSQAAIPPHSWPQLVEVLRSGSKTDRARADDLAAAHAATGAQRAERYLRLWLTSRGTLRANLMTKALRARQPSWEQNVEAEAARIGALFARLRALEVFEATASLLRLGDAALRRYAAMKLQRGLLDYDDLIAAAHTLLSRPDAAPWVLYKLDGGIDHILVDEAQDTSPLQWEVIQALTEEALSGKGAREVNRTIFAVGDEKQSIYSFQGADPSAFSRMRQFFKKRVQNARKGWEDVPLQMSFRSAPVILNAVDMVFAHPAARAGLQEADAVLAHSASRISDPGLVEIWPAEVRGVEAEVDVWAAPLQNRQANNPRERLAARIADEISRLCAGESITEKGETRRIGYGDILILVRRRAGFADPLIAALKDRNIPVAGSDRLTLREHIAAEDLLAAADFTLLPEDDLNLAALLRSPLIGLGEEDLYTLAHGREGSLWKALLARREEVPFGFVHERLAGWLNRSGFVAPFAFFSHILSAGRGRHDMLARLGAEASDAIDEFLTLALAYEHTATPSLQGFVHWFRAQSADIKRNMEEAHGQVRILTVHGAKGLEAPVVFLPDTCDVPGRGFAGPLVRLAASDASQPGHLVWAYGGYETAPEAVRDALDEAHSAQLAEYRRLLYVAMTRARDRLYICGALTRKEEASEGSWYALVRGALASHCSHVPAADGGEGILRLAEGPAGLQAAGASPEKVAEVALPHWALAQAPASEPPVPLVNPSALAADGRPPVLVADGEAGGREAALKRGRLIHLLLQHVAQRPPADRAAAGRAILARHAAEMEAGERAAIAEEAARLCEHAGFQALNAPGSIAEVAVAGLVAPAAGGGRSIQVAGQIDRLAIQGDEVLLADFKSNRAVPQQLSEVPMAYLAQLAAYRLAVAPQYPGKKVRALIVWTAEPSVMEIPGKMLDEAEAELWRAARRDRGETERVDGLVHDSVNAP